MRNRRTFQRFDIITVLEFKLLTALAGVFAGITKNFSYEGFCLETQCVTFEPGDSLEVRLRHPHSDLTVTVPASVVWKRTADKFACLMGIKLKETELDTKLRMLEIMSAAGDVPVDSFLSSGSDEGGEHEETASLARDVSQLKTHQAAPAETTDEDSGPEALEDEGLLSTEKDLITGKKSGSLFDEVFKAAQTEKYEEEEIPDEEPVESDMPWPRDNARQEKTDGAPGYSTRVLKQLLRNRTFIYSSIAAVIIGIAVYALFLIFQRPGNVMKGPAPVPAQSALRQEEDRSRIAPPVQDAGNNEAAAPPIQQPDEQPISKAVSREAIEKKVPALLPKLPDISTAEDQTQYIQVGAWRNPDNAREMLQRLKQYYPDAYLTAGKTLNKIKIPVTDKTRADKIMKDIEDKFNIKPLLTPER